MLENNLLGVCCHAILRHHIVIIFGEVLLKGNKVVYVILYKPNFGNTSTSCSFPQSGHVTLLRRNLLGTVFALKEVRE